MIRTLVIAALLVAAVGYVLGLLIGWWAPPIMAVVGFFTGRAVVLWHERRQARVPASRVIEEERW
jgi:uncharacterized membrane protein